MSQKESAHFKMYHRQKTSRDDGEMKRKRHRKRRTRHRRQRQNYREEREESESPVPRSNVQEQQGTFPAIVERKQTPVTKLQKYKLIYSPLDIASSCYSQAETESSSDECYGIGCVNRETNPTPRLHTVRITEESYPKHRRITKRKNTKKRVKTESSDADIQASGNLHPDINSNFLLPACGDRHPTRGGRFHLGSPQRMSNPRPIRSTENVFGLSSVVDLPPLPESRMQTSHRRPKLPPILPKQVERQD